MSTHVKRSKHIYLLGDFIFRPSLVPNSFFECQLQATKYVRASHNLATLCIHKKNTRNMCVKALTTCISCTAA